MPFTNLLSDLLTYLRSVWVWSGGDVCKLQRGWIVTSVLSLAVEADRRWPQLRCLIDRRRYLCAWWWAVRYSRLVSCRIIESDRTMKSG